jgi:hypothetical protein
VHETENAVLYESAPTPDDGGGEKVGLIIDETALAALLDEARDGPWTVHATLVVDDGVASRQRYAVLEVARRWFGPVEVVARADDEVTLRIAAQLHVPSRMRGGFEQQ